MLLRWIRARSDVARLGAMSDYWAIPALENVYLEDSWVLSISAQPGHLTFVIDLVLRERHPAYRMPSPGEQYCYRRGVLRFDGVTTLSWSGQGAPPAVDETAQPDFGSFDEVEVEGASYRLSGDFGHIVVESDLPTLELTE